MFGCGRPVCLLTSLLCCERLQIWICSVHAIQLWTGGPYVTADQHVKILVLDSLLRKICFQILSWKVTGITLKKNYNTWLFRISLHMLRIVYKLKCLYWSSTNKISIMKEKNLKIIFSLQAIRKNSLLIPGLDIINPPSALASDAREISLPDNPHEQKATSIPRSVFPHATIPIHGFPIPWEDHKPSQTLNSRKTSRTPFPK